MWFDVNSNFCILGQPRWSLFINKLIFFLDVASEIFTKLIYFKVLVVRFMGFMVVRSVSSNAIMHCVKVLFPFQPSKLFMNISRLYHCACLLSDFGLQDCDCAAKLLKTMYVSILLK